MIKIHSLQQEIAAKWDDVKEGKRFKKEEWLEFLNEIHFRLGLINEEVTKKLERKNR